MFGDLRFLFPWNGILKIPPPGNTNKVATSEIRVSPGYLNPFQGSETLYRTTLSPPQGDTAQDHAAVEAETPFSRSQGPDTHTHTHTHTHTYSPMISFHLGTRIKTNTLGPETLLGYMRFIPF